MDAWTGHEVPTLPGRSTPPRLYDSARQSVQPTDPGSTATMYVCGITPYDATHLGHAATMITFDLIHRAWRDAGVPVRYVQNVTDIDDPLLERAAHVRELLASGAAYQIEDGTGDVYFPISAAPAFGYESHLSRDDMLRLSAE